MTVSGPPPTSEIIRRLVILPERAMRRLEVRRWLCTYDATEVVGQIQSLVERCLKGDGQARIAELALVDFLLQAGDLEEIPLTALDLAAETEGLKAASLVLSDPPPHRRVGERMRLNRQERKPVPLGMRKWQAVLHDSRQLELLLADSDPAVVARLCQNPSIREVDVLTIASRRPTFPDILDAVARSRWLTSHEVRCALIQNPYARTGLAISLLPQTGQRFLSGLRFAGDLHPALLDAVELFLTLT